MPAPVFGARVLPSVGPIVGFKADNGPPRRRPGTYSSARPPRLFLNAKVPGLTASGSFLRETEFCRKRP